MNRYLRRWMLRECECCGCWANLRGLRWHQRGKRCQEIAARRKEWVLLGEVYDRCSQRRAEAFPEEGRMVASCYSRDGYPTTGWWVRSWIDGVSNEALLGYAERLAAKIGSYPEAIRRLVRMDEDKLLATLVMEAIV